MDATNGFEVGGAVGFRGTTGIKRGTVIGFRIARGWSYGKDGALVALVAHNGKVTKVQPKNLLKI